MRLRKMVDNFRYPPSVHSEPISTPLPCQRLLHGPSPREASPVHWPVRVLPASPGPGWLPACKSGDIPEDLLKTLRCLSRPQPSSVSPAPSSFTLPSLSVPYYTPSIRRLTRKESGKPPDFTKTDFCTLRSPPVSPRSAKADYISPPAHSGRAPRP